MYGTTQGEAFRKFAKETLDALIEKAIEETDPTRRQAMYEEIQRIAYDNALGMPLYQPEEVYVMRSWVKGWMFNPMRPGEANYDGIWKEE